jgi:hypothetical protein
MKLPGRAPAHSSELVSHRDLLPTLADYLEIRMPPGATRGQPIGTRHDAAVLTLAPSGRFGQLITPRRTVDLRLVFDPTRVTVTAANEASAQNEAEWLPLLAQFLQCAGR